MINYPDTLLAIDVATDICSVALSQNKTILAEQNHQGRGVHSEKLFTSIDEILTQHAILPDHIDTILLSGGPGSYTGLRIGVSAVKGFVFGHRKISVYLINSLLSQAHHAWKINPDCKQIHSVMDARRKHLFHQKYSVEGNQLIISEDVAIRPLTEAHKWLSNMDIITGTGIERIDEHITLGKLIIDKDLHKASQMISLFDDMYRDKLVTNEYFAIKKVEPESFEPYYYSFGHQMT